MIRNLKEKSHFCYRSVEVQPNQSQGLSLDLTLLLFSLHFLSYRLTHSMLNVGINDNIVELLAQMPGGNRRFALDTYQRFLQMFGCYILSIESKVYDDALKAIKAQENVESETDLSEQGLEHLVQLFKLIANVPQDPMTQFWLVIRKFYESFAYGPLV
jgi:hypothetical protein